MKKRMLLLLLCLLISGCSTNSENKEKGTSKKDTTITEKESKNKKVEKEKIEDNKRETPQEEESSNTPSSNGDNSNQVTSNDKTQSSNQKIDTGSKQQSAEPNEAVTPVQPKPSPPTKPETTTEVKPEPSPPVCNNTIPEGAYLNEDEAAAYAEKILTDKANSGEISVGGYDIEVGATQCGTKYYILTIYFH